MRERGAETFPVEAGVDWIHAVLCFEQEHLLMLSQNALGSLRFHWRPGIVPFYPE